MLADLLRAAMAERGLRQADLAACVGVPQSVVSRWLGPKAPRPSPESCDRIATFLGRDPAEITRLAWGFGDHLSYEAEDPEWHAMQVELREIFDSFERSKWRDLVGAMKAMVVLVR